MLGTKMSDACLGRVTGIVCYDSDIVFNETGFALRFSLKSRRCSHSWRQLGCLNGNNIGMIGVGVGSV
jgi:hypothetical protein